MRIAIIGSGGVGGYFGGKLANAGNDVTFLARGEQLKALRENGLMVKSILGDFEVKPVKTAGSITEIGFCDLIILGTKAWQLKEIVKDLKTIVKEDTVILPLQNGVSAVEELETEIDRKNIIAGLCRIISKIESPGIISHIGITPKIVFGELDNSITKRIQAIKELFDKAGFESVIAEDIMAELWKKFIAICASGLLAVTKTTHGELRELKETREMMTLLLSEIYSLSKKIGINIESDYVEKAISFIDTFPYDSTSSLTRDVWEGKPSEIEYQNGTVVRLAEKYNVEVPVNKFVYSCILPMEIKARKKKANGCFRALVKRQESVSISKISPK